MDMITDATQVAHHEAKRLQDQAAAVTARGGEYLTFRLGTEEYGIDILLVQEIRSYEAPTRIKLTLAVNIAPQQLKSDSLIDRLLGVLRETGFPPERFEIEITENALIGDLDLARRIVLGLKSHGIRVALDDFGTGYSSLSHLSELPFDKLKIDRSFIHTMHNRPESATIVNAIIGLGRSLNMPTTAEGIESAADAELLTRLGCNVGQGFLYSRPVPAREVQALIDTMHDASMDADRGAVLQTESLRAILA